MHWKEEKQIHKALNLQKQKIKINKDLREFCYGSSSKKKNLFYFYDNIEVVIWLLVFEERPMLKQLFK